MYAIDDEAIHDEKAMWDLALSIKCRYKFLTDEIKKLEESDFSINYNGKLLFKHQDPVKFKKAVREYKQHIATFEQVFGMDFKFGTASYLKYLTESN